MCVRGGAALPSPSSSPQVAASSPGLASATNPALPSAAISVGGGCATPAWLGALGDACAGLRVVAFSALALAAPGGHRHLHPDAAAAAVGLGSDRSGRGGGGGGAALLGASVLSDTWATFDDGGMEEHPGAGAAAAATALEVLFRSGLLEALTAAAIACTATLARLPTAASQGDARAAPAATLARLLQSLLGAAQDAHASAPGAPAALDPRGSPGGASSPSSPLPSSPGRWRGGAADPSAGMQATVRFADTVTAAPPAPADAGAAATPAALLSPYISQVRPPRS